MQKKLITGKKDAFSLSTTLAIAEWALVY